ncbi:MAG TPA: hypothetical protein VFO55_13685 [Gemmatimonadaceae bacterium]|nr:hypothetical protein [Gemmatimonadaceae bacterium]
MRRTQKVLAFVAIIFGLATVVSGWRVLAGADPGYAAFRPLLIFNTAMGVTYLAAGILILRSVEKGRFAAGAIFVLNLLVLGVAGYLHATEGAPAVESVRAMIFRTGMWLALFLGMVWLGRHSPETR